MSAIPMEMGQSPLRTGWKPGQIYEICMLDGEYKTRFIQRLRRTYAHHHIVSDRDPAFRTLREIQDYLDALVAPAELLILDISEILYLDFVKDAETLKGNLKALYASLGRLSKRGIICAMFVNYYYYYYIFHLVARPPAVQVLIFPSETLPFWEDCLAIPAALPTWRSVSSAK